MNEDEIFYPLKGYEGHYEINKIGQIKSVERKFIGIDGAKRSNKSKLMKTRLDKDGYEFLALRNPMGRTPLYINCRVHRLVAINFIANPNNLPIINHLNNIRNDNHYLNLEWSNTSLNSIHKFKSGYIIHLRKLKEEDVIFIYLNTWIRNGIYKKDGALSAQEMALKYNVCQRTIYKILYKITYKEITNKL